MSALVQYLTFLKNSRERNEKKEKTANLLPGFAPKVTGALKETEKKEGLTRVLTDAAQTNESNQNILPRVDVAAKASASMSAPAFTQAVSNPGRGHNTSVPRPQTQQQPTSIPRVMEGIESFSDRNDPRAGTLLDKRSGVKFARNTGIADVDGEIYVNTDDVELLSKLGFDYSCEEYLGLEKTGEVLDVYSYIEKVAGVPKEVAKLVDDKKAFSAEYLKDMGYTVPRGYEVKGDLVCPVEKTEQSFQQDEKEGKESSEKTAAADPAQTILITGHSGAGKSTLGKALAEKLNLPLHRVDAHPEFKEYVTRDNEHWKNSLTPGTREYEHYTDLVNRANRDTLKTSDPAAIIEGAQLGHLSPKELAKYRAHIVVGGDVEQSIAQRIQRAIDKAAKKGITLSPEEIELRKVKSKLVADYWHPGIEKFRKLPGVLSYNHTEHQIDPLVEQLKQLMGKKAELNKSSATDVQLKSSNIDSVGHDKKTKLLEVLFRNGAQYEYKDVPRGIYSRLIKAKSPGKFFNKHIKRDNRFEYSKIDK